MNETRNKEKKYSINVTTYNEIDNLEEGLGSLLALVGDDERFKVIVVDANSSDGTTDWLKEKDVELIQLEKRVSRGKGRAIAVEHSNCPHMVQSVDADQKYDEGFFASIKLYEELRRRVNDDFCLSVGPHNICPREMVLKAGNWPDINFAEDLLMMARLNRVGKIFNAEMEIGEHLRGERWEDDLFSLISRMFHQQVSRFRMGFPLQFLAKRYWLHKSSVIRGVATLLLLPISWVRHHFYESFDEFDINDSEFYGSWSECINGLNKKKISKQEWKMAVCRKKANFENPGAKE